MVGQAAHLEGIVLAGVWHDRRELVRQNWAGTTFVQISIDLVIILETSGRFNGRNERFQSLRLDTFLASGGIDELLKVVRFGPLNVVIHQVLVPEGTFLRSRHACCLNVLHQGPLLSSASPCFNTPLYALIAHGSCAVVRALAKHVRFSYLLDCEGRLFAVQRYLKVVRTGCSVMELLLIQCLGQFSIPAVRRITVNLTGHVECLCSSCLRHIKSEQALLFLLRNLSKPSFAH